MNKPVAKALTKLALRCAIAAAILLPLSTNDFRASADPVVRAETIGSPAALIAAHGCWTGAAPVDVIAGHAVVTKPNADRPTYMRSGPALEQIFGGKDHSLTVHAFCR